MRGGERLGHLRLAGLLREDALGLVRLVRSESRSLRARRVREDLGWSVDGGGGAAEQDLVRGIMLRKCTP